MKNLNSKLTIFNKHLNLNKKTTFKPQGVLGKKKYFPPVSKEWINTIYVFNKNNLKNLPVYDLYTNELIKNYFNLYLNPKYLGKSKYKFSKKRRLSFNKIYVSKAEVKHSSNKAIITIYLYNREKLSLLKKIKSLKESFYSKLFLKKSIYNINIVAPLKKEFQKEEAYINAILEYKLKKDLYKKNSNIGFLKTLKHNGINIKNLSKNFLIRFYKDLILLQRYKLKLNINKYKFEEKLLYKLKNLVFKIYNKKVEFNIVNMKSIILNSDFITKLLVQKIKNKKTNILKVMNTILNKMVLPKTNNIIERSPTIKSVDFNSLENKYSNSMLGGVLKKNSFSRFLNRNYYNVILKRNYSDIFKIIFNSINYKNLSGTRLQVKGRLSKRNRADRALLKVRWKGGLKNIDSSYKRLSSVDFRGYLNSNLEYSIYSSKRTIGAFAVKGWVSGK